MYPKHLLPFELRPKNDCAGEAQIPWVTEIKVSGTDWLREGSDKEHMYSFGRRKLLNSNKMLCGEYDKWTKLPCDCIHRLPS
jgi:hypothetical protein